MRLPYGESLPGDTWGRRHRGIVALLAAHAVGLPLFGLSQGVEPLHALVEGGIVGLITLVALLPRLGHRAQSVVASFGLMSSSAILTHFSGGYIEAHFHFFVMLGVIFLYEDWLPYVLSVGYVTVHHGIAGTLDPASVFNHPDAIADPWLWAAIHAVFILGLSGALIVAWNVIDRSRQAERAALEAQKAALAAARELRRQLGAQEKMAALGTLVAGLAHEVRTPLTIVSTNAALISMHAHTGAVREASAAELEGHVREIHASVDRINALVLQLRKFHRQDDVDREPARLDVVVQAGVDLFLAANRVTPKIRLDLQPTRECVVNVMGVQQVVLNLLANATEAVDPARGEVVVSTRDEPDGPVLVVEDNGAGMDAATQARIFEPLFTTKAEGMGLGLSIVQRIVEQQGARIDFDSRVGHGTRFRVRFSAAPSPAPHPVPVLHASPAPTSRVRADAA